METSENEAYHNISCHTESHHSYIVFYRAYGVCKHVGAILWYIEREVQLGKDKTSTSKKQKVNVLSKNDTKLQHFKKLLLRNRFHQKSMAHLVHQRDQKLQMSLVEN